jgi:hypothetical protein
MWHVWEREEVFTGFWLGGPKASDHWENLGIGFKMDLRESAIDGANWIQLAQDGAQWRSCVNTVMDLRVP